jgi:hypothetical protein
MRSDPTPAQRSLLVRFCDAFLQERNIKWTLLVGMLILLGSSLLLVSAHWDTYTPLWKYLIFLGYTGLIFAAGEWTRHRLVLPRTATVLQALTVLLLPITFLVLHWVMRKDAGLVENGFHIVVLVADLGFSVLAAGRIFRHFLRGRQPTFLACFLILALSGAIVPGLPEAWAPLVALALWAVFAAGSVKVNRHVFWLIEEHRAPRIFGFFPILLLGSQFLILFALHAPNKISLDWIGFGCVLTAIPVLLTADAVARVFQQRTGDLVRPLPRSIIGPLGLGLVLCAAGVCLAGVSIATDRYALVLTSALAAVMMAVTARRTGKQAFVWAMLAGIVLAYNFSPAFFIDLVRDLLNLGARLVHEERLPYAFYGLTYLPLLLTLTIFGRRLAKAGNDLFAKPLIAFSIVLGCLMLAVSFGHVKALFPVAMSMTLMFSLQVILFREGRLALLAILSWIVTAAGFSAFATTVLGRSLPVHAEMICLAMASTAILIAGRYFDAPIGRLLPEAIGKDWGNLIQKGWQSLCATFSLILALGLAATWLLWHCITPLDPASWPVTLFLALLLITQSLCWVRPLLGGATILFSQAMILGHLLALQVSIANLLSVFTGLLLSQWVLGYFLDRHPHSRLGRTFALANYQVSCFWLSLGLIGVYFPVFIFEMIRPMLPALVGTAVGPLLEIGWPFQFLMVAWAFDAARRQTSPIMSTVGSVGVLGVVGALLMNQAGPAAWLWLPATWTITALAALPIVEILHRRLQKLRDEWADQQTLDRYHVLSVPTTYVILGVLGLAAVGSLLAFPLAMRVAGTAGLVGLVAFSILRRQPQIRLPALILVNWQLISLTVLLFGPPMQTLFDLDRANLAPLCLPVALVATASMFLWQFFAKETESPWRETIWGQLWGLRVLAALAICGSLKLPALGISDVLLVGLTFSLAVAAELVSACRQSRTVRVWIAEALALAGAAFFTYFHVLTIGHGPTMFALLGVGILLWLIGEWARGRGQLSILSTPLVQTALVLPLATVAIGGYRHLTQQPVWLGANSLALLLAAGFYFWRGLERSLKSYLILSGVILNIALVLLWRELNWDDPQFFMIPVGISILALVQLLKQEIPERLHDPLRYLGALVILVSPVFHIVDGSWLHLFSLMVASVGVALLAIGLRVRALMYTGTAFLVADLVAMVVRGSIDDPNVLWISGLALGAAVIALGAWCERNREALVERMRYLADVLKQWE